MDSKYVYPYTHSYAKNCSKQDLESYANSYKQNVACKKAIEQIIKENFDGMRLKADSAKSVIAEFGYDRVNWVVANTIQRKKDDGRFSRENKEWLNTVYIPLDKVSGTDRRKNFVVDSHSAVLDGFINQAKSEYQALNLWNYKQCHDPVNLDFEGKVMVLDATNLKDEYKNPETQLVLCESGFGCSSTASGRKVFGRFLIDGEQCQYERSDFIGQLKEELLPDWAELKLHEMGVTQEQEETHQMGGMKME